MCAAGLMSKRLAVAANCGDCFVLNIRAFQECVRRIPKTFADAAVELTYGINGTFGWCAGCFVQRVFELIRVRQIQSRDQLRGFVAKLDNGCVDTIHAGT